MAGTILIAGGGIGGLTAALALAKRGVASHILEQRETFSEAGAGIQLGPNATRILLQLGLGERLRSHVFQPGRIVIRRGASGGVLAELPLGAAMEARHGAPYWTLHRSGLQAVLLHAVRAEPMITVSLGWKVAGLSETPDVTTAVSDAGQRLSGVALLGADGLWSAVRKLLFGDQRLRPVGRTAWRAVIDRPEAPGNLGDADVGLWLGPKAHLVHYPVAAGAKLAIIAVIEEPVVTEGWDSPADASPLTARFADWHATACALLQAVPQWRQWTLYEMPALSAWTLGRAALIGDAAHPVLPFLAQGGALVIEDAMLLAGLLAAGNNGTTAALRRYEVMRRQRVQRVQAASRRNGMAYHLRGPAAMARDAVLSMTPGRRLIAQFDWLYGARIAD